MVNIDFFTKFLPCAPEIGQLIRLSYVEGSETRTASIPIPSRVRRTTVYEIGKISRFPSFRRKTHKDLIDDFDEKTANSQKLRFKNQSDKFAYMAKIEIRRLITIPLCIVMTLLSGTVLGLSYYSPYYEYIDYDIKTLNESLIAENNLTFVAMNLNTWDSSDADTLKYFLYNLTGESERNEYHVLTRYTFLSTFDHVHSTDYFFLYKSHSSLWETCNFLSGMFFYFFFVFHLITATRNNGNRKAIFQF
jgi:hypothetical protein